MARQLQAAELLSQHCHVTNSSMWLTSPRLWSFLLDNHVTILRMLPYFFVVGSCQSASSAPSPTLPISAPLHRMPIGGPNGAPLEVTLTRAKFDELALELYRRCRLPLDQAAWQAGVELQELLMELEAKKKELQRRGVPQWKQQMLQVGAELQLGGGHGHSMQGANERSATPWLQSSVMEWV
jgi:hypothetical protein